MPNIAEIVTSPYLIAIVVGWLMSHIVKYIVMSVQGKRVDLLHELFMSGGMPSSHTATIVAVWTVILLSDGADSGLFGLATAVALIVGYDAVKVRRSVGEQGEAIQALIKQTKVKVPAPRAARGHTPLEVLAGACVGVIIGAIVFFATK